MQTDTQLQRHVLDELNWEPSIDAAQVGVTAKAGIVTLTGHLPVYVQKHKAEEVAKRVHGVRAVANEIEVRPTEAHVRDDEELAAAAVHALEWDANVPDTRLQVLVEDGRVTLEGAVEHQFQRSEAERVVRHLSGVREITNAIGVTPPEAVSAMEGAIQDAMGRNAALHARKISVVADGPMVVLTGDVHSYTELEEAVRIAWSAPGVRNVQNCMTVTPWGFGPAEEWGY